MLASCMNDRARAASAEYALASRLATEWTHNQADVYALDEEDLILTYACITVATILFSRATTGCDRSSGAPDTHCPTRPSLKWE